MTFIPFPLKNPKAPSIFHICLKLFIVPIPLYSNDEVYYKVLKRSNGLVIVLETAPAIPPVNKCPSFTESFFIYYFYGFISSCFIIIFSAF